jgi:hypothetical protein
MTTREAKPRNGESNVPEPSEQTLAQGFGRKKQRDRNHRLSRPDQRLASSQARIPEARLACACAVESFESR